MNNCTFIKMEQIKEIKPLNCVIKKGREEIWGEGNCGIMNIRLKRSER